jgi:hypothetical protein
MYLDHAVWARPETRISMACWRLGSFKSSGISSTIIKTLTHQQYWVDSRKSEIWREGSPSSMTWAAKGCSACFLTMFDNIWWRLLIMFVTMFEHIVWWLLTMIFDDVWPWFLIIVDHVFDDVWQSVSMMFDNVFHDCWLYVLAIIDYVCCRLLAMVFSWLLSMFLDDLWLCCFFRCLTMFSWLLTMVFVEGDHVFMYIFHIQT